MSSSHRLADAPIAAGGPPSAAPSRPDDPFRLLDELLEVLEALSPGVPERPLRPIGTDYRL
jgi:hypothetical protein